MVLLLCNTRCFLHLNEYFFYCFHVLAKLLLLPSAAALRFHCFLCCTALLPSSNRYLYLAFPFFLLLSACMFRATPATLHTLFPARYTLLRRTAYLY